MAETMAKDDKRHTPHTTSGTWMERRTGDHLTGRSTAKKTLRDLRLHIKSYYKWLEARSCVPLGEEDAVEKSALLSFQIIAAKKSGEPTMKRRLRLRFWFTWRRTSALQR